MYATLLAQPVTWVRSTKPMRAANRTYLHGGQQRRVMLPFGGS
jgi:hypothetical protein